MKTSIFQLIAVLLLLYSIPVGAQESVDTLLLEKCRKEVDSINKSILNRAYIFKQGSFSALAGKSVYINTTQWLPHVYFDRKGKVKKLVHKGELGEVYISYFDDDGYLLYMVSKDYYLGLGLSSIIYANKKRVVYADFEGYNEDEGIGDFNYKQYEGEIPEKVNGVNVGAFAHVDSIRSFYNVSLDPPVDTQRVSFELLMDNLPVLLNRGEIPEPQERKEPSDWQLKHFGRPKKFTLDEDKLEDCRKAVSRINEIPLTKLYEVNTDSTTTWQMFTEDSIAVDINDIGDAHNIYVDSRGKLRKYIHNSYDEAESTYSLTAYYDENGNLLKLLCDNISYDTIYTFTAQGREYYDIKDANIYSGIFCLNGKLIMQTYNRMDFYNNNTPTQYMGAGSQLLSRIGQVDISKLHHADSVISSLKLNFSAFDLQAGTSICFKGSILRTLKMINTQKTPVRVAPMQNARVQATVDAGLNANIVEKKFDQFVEGYGTHGWYKVSFSNSTNYEPGYIYGGFLEPGESIYIKKGRTWRRSSY